jgi:aryl-alcohol dehydrogenase-like predicted oxidoreductase
MKYKFLGKSGLRVSELCLGTMTFGTEWGYGADEAEAILQMQAFTEAGGNFIDTANRYTEGSSERIIGNFIQSQRNKYVIATKYTLWNNREDPNAHGNHRKNMVHSLEGSLQRLKTDYVDVLYLHIWDFTTPIEEIMRGMDDLVRSGKVLYVAISDTPAWIVSRANTLAEWRDYAPLLALQCELSLIQRSPERDLIPMADFYGMTVTAWAPLAGGALSGKYLHADAKGRVPEHSLRRSERANQIVKKVVEIAGETQMSATQVALSWLRQKYANVIPVIGARNTLQLNESLACLDKKLTEQHIQKLDEVSRIEPGFPHDFLQSEGVKDATFGGLIHRLQHDRFPKL